MYIISVKNLTAAQIGKKSLMREGIFCEIVSVDPNLTKNGCSYGLSFYDVDKRKVKGVLSGRGITFGEVGSNFD